MRGALLVFSVVAAFAASASHAKCRLEPSPSAWCDPETPTVIEAEVLEGYNLNDDADVVMPLRIVTVSGAPLEGVDAGAEVELEGDGNGMQASDVTLGAALLLANENGRVVVGRKIVGDRVRVDVNWNDTFTVEEASRAALDDRESCEEDLREAAGWTEPAGPCDDTPDASGCSSGGDIGALGLLGLLALSRRRSWR